jgi:tether containing UBX domain for GLUT4
VCRDARSIALILTYSRNNNKPVDLSRTFRQTGLSSGAKLELVMASRSPSVVSVALQLPEREARNVPGGRLTDKFTSNTTLWMILRKFESNGMMNFNFTGRGIAQTVSGDSGAGRIYYETPVLNIMGRELSSFTDLQKTLGQLGLNSGSSLIRLNFRKTETPLEEARAEIGQYFKSMEEPATAGAHSGTAADTESTPEGAAGPVTDAITGEVNLDTSTAMPIDPPESSASSNNTTTALTPATPSEASIPDEIVVGPNQRPISVFAPPSSKTPKAALDPHNEDDYEPTVAHAKLHQLNLQAKSRNKRLLSDAELQQQAAERAARQAAIKEVSIKVRFPDQLTVVSSFTVLDNGETLYDFVRGVIAAEDQPFSLSWMSPKGPQTIPTSTTVCLIKDLGFAGRMVVNFNWDDGASTEARSKTTLKQKYVSKAKELQVQEVAAVQAQEEESSASMRATPKDKESSGGGKSRGGIPKWLKLPGKK